MVAILNSLSWLLKQILSTSLPFIYISFCIKAGSKTYNYATNSSSNNELVLSETPQVLCPGHEKTLRLLHIWVITDVSHFMTEIQMEAEIMNKALHQIICSSLLPCAEIKDDLDGNMHELLARPSQLSQ